MRFINLKSFSNINNHLIDYPSPQVSYLNSLGALSGFCLTVQLLSGILLTAHYTPYITLAFTSLEHILRDVNDG
jgi:quinol-cytochrome oxidoreductase complex cytochrome b subunit